ncbi:MAG TPA: alginate export family protein [Candidatus Binatia bacterium]|nr:alginate export family protein [Candidatus Binatia bacterium]
MAVRAQLATLLAWLSLASLAVPTSAEVTVVDAWPNLRTSASLRTRGEFHNFFDPGGTADNDYAFGATVLRSAIAWRSASFDLVIEGQNSALFGLPDDAVLPPPQGALDLGAVYFANNRAQNDASVFLKQAYLNLKQLWVDGLSVKGGRFEFSEGSEVLTGEPTLDWLKNLRLSQRLIGPFGFSHVGRSFDGVTAELARGPFNVTTFAAHPTQGGFDLAGNKEMSDIDLGYVALNLTRPELAKNSDARFFYIYYSDGRGLLKTDNRPLDVRATDRNHIEIHSEGAHYIQAIPSAAGTFDALAWGTVQQGKWGFLDHHAWAYALEAGWQPTALPAKPWVRIGYGRTSGDDDPNDGDHGTFFQIIPTGRIYSYSTYYNLMNDEDAFAQLLLRPIPGLLSRTDFHNIRVTESKDLWYQGSGATVSDRDVGFGYSGRPANGHHDLMEVIETSLSYDWNTHVFTNLYYGHLFGGGVVRAIFDGDQADFGYIEVTIRL